MSEKEGNNDLGYTFRDRIIVLETQIRRMISDFEGEKRERSQANEDRRKEVDRLNANMDAMRQQIHNEIESNNNHRVRENEKLSDKIDKQSKIIYTLVGIGIAFNAVVGIIAAIKH